MIVRIIIIFREMDMRLILTRMIKSTLWMFIMLISTLEIGRSKVSQLIIFTGRGGLVR